MAEVDVKTEVARLNTEAQQLTQRIQQLVQQMQGLDQQRQALVNELVKRQGAMEMLQRLDSNKEVVLSAQQPSPDEAG